MKKPGLYLKIISMIIFVHVSSCRLYMCHVCAGLVGNEKEVSNPGRWNGRQLGTDLELSERASSALTCHAVSPVPRDQEPEQINMGPKTTIQKRRIRCRGRTVLENTKLHELIVECPLLLIFMETVLEETDNSALMTCLSLVNTF